LNESGCIQAVRLRYSGVENPGEKASTVMVRGWHEDQHAFEAGGANFHLGHVGRAGRCAAYL
jgi:hypothetical protein